MLFNKTKKRLKGIIECGRILGCPEADITAAQEFLEYNEPGLCLDQIVTQLNEYDIAITHDFYDLVEKTAKCMSIVPPEYSYLQNMTKNERSIPEDVRKQVHDIVQSLL